MKKVCTTCQQSLPLNEFYKKKRGQCGRSSVCKQCAKKYRKKHYKDTGGWDSKKRDTQYLNRYGISLKEYERLLEDQNSRCCICNTSQPGGKGTFHVDHDHATGTVRGLLCHACNLGLGLFRDDTKLLIQAVSYLQGGN